MSVFQPLPKPGLEGGGPRWLLGEGMSLKLLNEPFDGCCWWTGAVIFLWGYCWPGPRGPGMGPVALRTGYGAPLAGPYPRGEVGPERYDPIDGAGLARPVEE